MQAENKPLIEQSVAELSEQLRARVLSAETLARVYLDRIAAREPVVKAFAHIDPDNVLTQARALDAGPWRGPMHGLPVAIKDIIATADQPTEYGSPIYRGHRPAWDASCVAAIRAGGGVILGKTVTTEFALTYPGKTVNPHDPGRTPGGSSSGSAAAVADGMAPLALGTQTGGSMIRPAAFCGVIGYKPSFNLIERHGVKPVSHSLDTVGAFARDVAGTALLVSTITGRPELMDAAATTPPRIGVWRTPAWAQAAPETIAAIERAIKLFEARGTMLRDAPVPPVIAEADTAHHEVEHFEMVRALAYEINAHPGDISTMLMRRLKEGAQIPPAQYDKQRQVATACRRAFAGLFADSDLLLYPSTLGEAPLGLASTGNALFNRILTLFGVPCVTLPFGRGPNGLPLGLQIIGPFGGDRQTLAYAAWAELALATA